jgi:hypothetical protein
VARSSASASARGIVSFLARNGVSPPSEANKGSGDGWTRPGLILGPEAAVNAEIARGAGGGLLEAALLSRRLKTSRVSEVSKFTISVFRGNQIPTLLPSFNFASFPIPPKLNPSSLLDSHFLLKKKKKKGEGDF